MASIKVSDLQATTSAAAESFLYLADTSNGGAEFDSKKITVANFLGAYATEAFVNSAISDLINGAPEALDTLKEISDAIGDSGDIVGNLIGMIDANESHVDNMATLTGVLKDAADLGSFSGSTIADSATIKSALQALETSLETKGSAAALSAVTSKANDLVALTGLAAGTTDFGVFTGDTLSDNATLKTVLQDAETKMELTASELDTEEAARIAADALLLPLAGGTMSGDINLSTETVLGVDGTASFSGLVSSPAVPTSPEHLVNKAYLDSLDNENDAQVQANTDLINTEIANRQAADALLLPLAGGTMTGAIQMGFVGNPEVSWVHTSNGTTTGPSSVIFDTGDNTTVNKFKIQQAASNNAAFQASVDGNGWSSHTGNTFEGHQRYIKVKTGGEDVGKTITVTLLESGGTAPILYELKPHESANWTNFYSDVIGTGYVSLGSGGQSTLGVDGTASFSGLVSASTAPTANDHLVNKLYADNLVAGVDLSGIAVNAANLAQEITDRTNADTTLQSNIDAEEAARIAADNTLTTNLAGEVTNRTNADATLQSNIDAEEAARIAADSAEQTARVAADDAEAAARAAADALLLPLAGGTMSGAIEFGSAPGGAYTANPQVQAASTRGDGSEPFDGLLTERFELTPADGIPAVLRFNPITVNTSLRIYAALWTSSEIKLNRVFNGESQDVPVVDTGVFGTNATYNDRYNKQWYDIAVTTPFELTSIGHDSDVNHAGNYYAIEVDGVIIEDGVTTFSTAAATTINVDGTASFSGLISAPLAPTADEHLANKLYVDSTAASNAAAIEALTNGAPELLNTLNELAQAINDDENFSTTVTNLVASETTARTAADATLQANIDAEEAARIAADGLLLPLAGGTMSGAVQFGSGSGSGGQDSLTIDLETDRSDASAPHEMLLDFGADSSAWSGIVVTVANAHDANSSTNGTSFYDDPGVDANNELNLYTPTKRYLLIQGTPTVNGGVVTVTANAGEISYTLRSHSSQGSVPISTGTLVAGPVITSTIGVDGTASFSGLITAPTAPTANGHLVNKAYSDASVAQEVADRQAAVSAEEAARIAADNTLTANLAQEVSDRQAADALLLPLSGGNITGTLNVGTGSVVSTYTSNAAVASGRVAYPPESFFNGDLGEYGVRFQRFASDTDQPSISFNQLTATSSVRLYVVDMSDTWNHGAPYLSVNGIQTMQADYDVSARFAGGTGWHDVSSFLTFPINVTSVGLITGGGQDFKYVDIRAIEIDGVLITEGMQITTPGGVATTFNSNGSASFSGLVSAALAPTANEHLANKQYVDTKHASSVSDLNQEIADRQAGDAVLQAAIDAEEAARIAADAQLLQLTGGSMAGPIDFGGVTQINPDGSADFSGLISADSVPTLPQHLTNKLYVDTQVAVNAAAIESVVGGAPELLNTLNELAQAIGDDENFVTTITNAIAAETAARTAADTTLQTNIDIESAARVAADNLLTVNLNTEIADRQAADAAEAAARAAADSLLLPLAGGNMSGAITFAGATQTGTYSDPSNLFKAYSSVSHVTINGGSSVTFAPIRATSSVELRFVGVDQNTMDPTINGIVCEDVLNGLPQNGTLTPDDMTVVDVSSFLTFPIDITEIGMIGSTVTSNRIHSIVVDGETIVSGVSQVTTGGGISTTLRLDGSAEFNGLISAATAPSAGEHLTNKTYVDSLSSANSTALTNEIAARTAADATLQVNIDAEAATRASADNTLTVNLAQEVSDRQAADALLLPLAGGTMTGDLNVGSSQGNIVTLQNSWDALPGGHAYSGRTVTYTGGNAITKIVIRRTDGNLNFITVDGVQVTDSTGWTVTTDGDWYNGRDASYIFSVGDTDLNNQSYANAASTTGSTYIELIPPAPITGEITLYSHSGDTDYDFYEAAEGGAITVGVDGTISVSGLVTAPTAPTAPEHLTNKAYVDSKAASNAAAIEAVVGGAPELLNTLNELAQAISDDENFSTTVTNLIASETSARTAADTTLQVNIDAEAATRATADATLTSGLAQEVSDRQAADALLLPLAGGTMSGAIQLGVVAGNPQMSWVHTSNSDTTGPSCVIFDTGDSTTVNKFKIEQAASNNAVFQYSTDGGAWGSPGSANTFEGSQRYIKVKTGGEDVGKTITVTLLESAGTAPILWETKHHESASWTGFFSDVIDTGYVSLGGGGNSTLGIDGTASFSGLISAATAPTADAHLTNKLYVDALAATNASGLTQEIADRQAADAAESAARIAADNTLTTNLAQEVSDRQAGDATLTTNLAQEIADRIAAVAALTNGAVADNTAAIAQEAADRVAADALKVDKQSLVNEHLLGQTSAQSVPVDAEGNSNYLFLVVDKATGALKSIDKTFLEAE